jgi:glucokinase
VNTYLAVDVGGTHIRVGLYPVEGTEPIKLKRIPTHGEGPAAERLIGLIEELLPTNDTVTGLAVAAPGPLDPKAGVLFSAPNIPGWVNFPLRKILEDHFHIPVELGNDANMATLGEWKYGAGRGHHHMIYMTISTGIGGGAIVDDRLVLGHCGLATELGHVTIVPEGPMCGCGQRGHLEALASGTAIARYVSEQLALNYPSSLKSIQRPSAKDISLAAQNGDALAIEALARAGSYVGQALANYLHIFNPTVVVFGGGVTLSGPFLLEPLRKSLSRRVMSPAYLTDLQIKTVELGDEAGLLGALALVRSLHPLNQEVV